MLLAINLLVILFAAQLPSPFIIPNGPANKKPPTADCKTSKDLLDLVIKFFIELTIG